MPIEPPEFLSEQLVQADGSNLQVDAYSVPEIADWDADGLTDLIVGEKTAAGEGKVRVYLNTGTAAAPVYVAPQYVRAEDADLTVPAAGCLGVFPQVVDFDYDGRKDLLLGLADGRVQVRINQNTDTDPQFGPAAYLQVGTPGSATDVDVGARATIEVVDFDNDGRFDIFLGAYDGKVQLLVDQATHGTPEFHQLTPLQDGAADLAVPTGRSSPAVYDLDGDGRKDLIAGNTEGQLYFYANVGSDSAPAFASGTRLEADHLPIDLPGTPRSRPFVGDLNADGIFDVLVGAEDGLLRLYAGQATNPTGQPGPPLRIVDPDGGPVEIEPGGLTRVVYDCSALEYPRFGCYVNAYLCIPTGLGECVSYWLGRSEGEPERGPNPTPWALGSTDVDDVYDLLGLAHNYYGEKFGRNGANGNGALGYGTGTAASVLMKEEGPPSYCHQVSGHHDELIFCAGTVYPDVVGHEFAHAVAWFSVPFKMAYLGETGSLEESFADVMGEMLEYYGAGDNDWINFPQVPELGPHNLADPPNTPHDPPYADRFHSPDFYYGDEDDGGAQWNAGVPNKAFYLTAMGGAFNGYYIQGIGREKAEQIWYRAMTTYYTSTETFNGAYLALIQAADDLYDEADVAQVTKALQAVEMDLPRLTDGPAVVGRYVFYNNSAADGNTLAADAQDDEAIATNKRPLLTVPTRSGPAVAANYTSYSRGLNGIMIDVDNLPTTGQLSADDFEFRIGNSDDPTTWTPAPPPLAVGGITVRPVDLRNDGTIDVDRVTIIWPDGAINNQWLEVTVLPTADTGLAASDVFYYGNAVAEAGDSTTDAKVTTTDLLLARNNPRGFLSPAEITFPYDFNRDQRVDAIDVLLARNNRTSLLDELRLIDLTGEGLGDQGLGASSDGASLETLAWLAEHGVDRPGANDRTAAAQEAVDLLLKVVGSG
ncbi:MAG: M4 family metallopeptidase [Candidatus Nealsonbacteria bacterium]|nr:M4 family metallopeptidase [Candidatus Nealsonbacteria bacterium]